MKPSFKSVVAAVAIGVAMSVAAIAETTPPGFVDFGKLTPTADGGEFVEVKLSRGLIQMASKFTRKHEPDVADLLKNLESVRVNVVPLGDDNRGETEKKAESIRTELEGKGWEQIVSVREKNQNVAVLLKTRDSETVEGVVVTVIEGGNQAIFLNVVGNVKLEDIARLGEKLNLEPLRQVGEAISKEAGKEPAAKQP